MSNLSQKSMVLIGLLWSGSATILTKGMSLFSQFFLGIFLETATYGVFAIIVSSLVFVSVFQNTGVHKMLISNHNEYSTLFPDYSAFIFISSIIGFFLLIAIGFWEIRSHEIQGLIVVYFITAFSIPLIAIATLFSSKLSIELNFKGINMVLMGHAVVYYCLTIFLAWMGAEIYSIAIANLIAAAIQLALYRKLSGNMSLQFKLRPRKYIGYVKKFRWILISGLLSALAMRADFLVLSKMLSITDLGLYYFGFMLVMSLTALISIGINQTLLPIFAKQLPNPFEFQKQFIDVSMGIAIASSFLSILIITFGPFMMHFLWGGKWDGATIVVVMAALFIPLRMMNVIAHTTLEAKANWTPKTYLLILEIVTLVILVYIGASLGGLIGACIGITLQRIISSLVSFPFVCNRIGIKFLEIFYIFLRTLFPFIVSIAANIYFQDNNFNLINIDYSGIDIGAYSLYTLLIWMIATLICNYRLSLRFLSQINWSVR